jgi:sialate O-acetylesterase
MQRHSQFGLFRVAIVFALAGILPLQADVKMPAIFGDHMVLQQELKVPIWGAADPGEKVTVTAGDHTGTATADASGKWRVDLAPFAPNTPVLSVTVSGHNTVTFQDVLIGDVWIAGGQSNMEFAFAHGGTHPEDNTGYLGGVLDAANEDAKAIDPQLRIFYVGHKMSVTPVDDVVGKWQLCTPESVADFSGVAYYFGREIRNAFHRPVGLIGSYYGGTGSETWTSLDGFQKNPPFQDQIDWIGKLRAAPPPALERHMPSVLFNGMIAPLVPYAIKGVIWYQGEDNGGNPVPYRTLFPRLITDWRDRWGQGDFPFLFVQIAEWAGNGGPAGNNWPMLREAQTMALSLPNTGMATAIDVGDTYNIHPRDKLDVGIRLGLAAKHIAYGQDLVISGPTYSKMAIEGNTIRVSFTPADPGLVIGRSPHPPADEAPIPTTDLLGFVIAGADQKFVQAQAKIDGATVVVSSPQVPNPVAVRYDWAHSTQANLYGKDNLPALPFRSDNWDNVVSPAFPPAQVVPATPTP